KLKESIAYLDGSRDSVDCILLDLTLPDAKRLDGLRTISKQFPDIPVIIMTGGDEEKLALGAIQLGAEDYLIKGEFRHNLLEKAILYSVERKKKKAIILNAERKMQMILRNINEVLILLNSELVIDWISPSVSQLFDLQDEFLFGKHINSILPNLAPENLEQGTLSSVSIPNKSLWVDINCSAIEDGAYVLKLRNITQRKLVERELSLNQIKNISNVLDSYEQEKEKMAHDLHDSLGQFVSVIKLYLLNSNVEKALSKDLYERVTKIIEGLESEYRFIVNNLHIPVFDGIKFDSILNQFFRELENYKSIEINCEWISYSQNDKTLELNLYRILQELIFFSLKREKSTAIDVQVYQENKSQIFKLVNNGKRLNLSKPEEKRRLQSTLSKVSLINGDLSLPLSNDEKNTYLLRIPLEQKFDLTFIE
ncbi:MAG: response regulator, partial [Flavobacteriales bacterium]|nr:response regulator [Flavobacteriales bacterium]